MNPKAIDVAMRRVPADLLLRNVRLFNLVTGELERTEIAIAGETIAGIGEGYEALETIDAEGLTAVPGFTDAHVHIESSLVTPYAWEEMVLPHGTTSAVCDPHELANVAGTPAIDYFLACTKGMVLRLQVNIPSCVPALPSEVAGARLDAEAIAPYAEGHGLSEMMNVPGVLGKDPDVLRKLELFSGHPIDGHLPLVGGDALNALCAAGIANDHESSQVAEALEKLRRGMTVFLRAGSLGDNIGTLAPLLTLTHSEHCCLCTDDRDPSDILEHGHIDAAIRIAIAQGCDPLAVYRAASLAPARHFGWRNRGLLAPGYVADIVLLSDLNACTVTQVICRGKCVTPDLLAQRPPAPDVSRFLHSVKCAPLTAESFKEPTADRFAIGLTDGTIVTEQVPLPTPDCNLVALIARHGTDERIGTAWVKGFGLTRGALASTIGHDSHNLCVVGASREEMALAANALRECGGGFAVVEGSDVKALLPLPVGGLMSPLSGVELAETHLELQAAARALCPALHSPMMALAFLPLPVIPAARVTLDGFTAV